MKTDFSPRDFHVHDVVFLFFLSHLGFCCCADVKLPRVPVKYRVLRLTVRFFFEKLVVSVAYVVLALVPCCNIRCPNAFPHAS